MGSDLSVVNAARVSFAKESDWELSSNPKFLGDENITILAEKDQKLINYLAKHNHWSPFAHAFLSFRVKVPMFVAMQLDKHTVGLNTNSVSRRYVDEEPEFYFPDVWRGRPEGSVKQGSGDREVYKLEPYHQEGTHVGASAERVTEQALDLYLDMIDSGVAPEQARMILPMNMMTERIWSGSLAAFARVCKLRLDPHAQKETQEVAKMINDLVPKEFEHSWNALLKN